MGSGANGAGAGQDVLVRMGQALLGRFDQAAEQGVGLAGSGEKFRVVLAGGEEGVILELHQFHEAAIR